MIKEELIEASCSVPDYPDDPNGTDPHNGALDGEE